MERKLIHLFLYSAGAVLFGTAAAKLISSFGTAAILQNPDPILGIHFQKLFWLVGAFELVVALVCFFGKRTGLRAGLVAWLASIFAVYRLDLLWVGYQKPCPCLGNLTDALHVSPQAADTAMKIVLSYLLVGSYAALFWLWKHGRKSDLPPAATNAASATM